HGNRDFCRDGENCLVVDPDPASVAAAIRRLLDDPDLRGRLSDEGRRTARRYSWDARIDELERFFESVAPARAVSRVCESASWSTSSVAPEVPRRSPATRVRW